MARKTQQYNLSTDTWVDIDITVFAAEKLSPDTGDFVSGFLDDGTPAKYKIGNLPSGSEPEIQTFTNGDLDGTFFLIVTHSKGRKFVGVTVWDNNDNEISLDNIPLNTTQVRLNLGSSITGTYTVGIF